MSRKRKTDIEYAAEGAKILGSGIGNTFRLAGQGARILAGKFSPHEKEMQALQKKLAMLQAEKQKKDAKKALEDQVKAILAGKLSPQEREMQALQKKLAMLQAEKQKKDAKKALEDQVKALEKELGKEKPKEEEEHFKTAFA